MPRWFCQSLALLCLLVYIRHSIPSSVPPLLQSASQRRYLGETAAINDGRTAICINGRIKLLRHQWKNVHELANSQELRFASPLFSHTGGLADNIIENVLKPLSRSGGVDVFLHHQSLGMGTESSPLPGNVSACEPLVDPSIFSSNSSNRFFCRVLREEYLLTHFREKNPLWATYFQSLKHAHEGLLQQLYGTHECNNAVKDYAIAHNVSYKYKMRLRADMAFLEPIKLPKFLEFKDSSGMNKIYNNFWNTFPGGNEDSFAFGLASDMDIFFNEYLDLIQGVNHVSLLKSWNNEQYLSAYLRSKNIIMDKHYDGFKGVIIRQKGHVSAALVDSEEALHSNDKQPIGGADWKEMSQ